MGQKYDPNKLESYIMYFDVNNLYGAAMCHYLPYDGFEWTSDFPEISLIENDSETGYIFEVDLDYPLELDDLHKDLPLCPQHMIPPITTLKYKQLVATLFPKQNYIIHYRNLKQCLDLGLKILKVHRVLKFKQSPWLKNYIDLNTELRKKSTTPYAKNFYKLQNNSCFGKTMENIRKHREIKIVKKWEGRYGARNYIAKPNFHSCEIFEKDLVIIEMAKTHLTFNKPIYVGMSILDISKTYMYNFHYNFILKHFLNQSLLLYTDSDSLIYYFLTPDIYAFIKNILTDLTLPITLAPMNMVCL